MAINELDKLYELVVNNDVIYTKQLNKIGFTSKDINELIDGEILIREKRGEYKFIDDVSLYNFGVKCKRTKKYNVASQCFIKAFEINPNNMKVCSMLLLESFGNSNFNKFFEYLEILDKNDDNFSHQKFNLILYLISFFTKVPEKYVNYLKNLRVNDLFERDEDEQRNKYNKEVAIDVLGQNFGHLCKIMSLRMNSDLLDSTELLICKLGFKVTTYHDEFNEKLNGLINRNNYEQALLLLEKKEKANHLSKLHLIVKKILEKFLDFKQNKIVNINYTRTTSVLEALDNNNFKLALENNQKYNVVDYVKDSRHIDVEGLLKKLCSLAEKSSLAISGKVKVEFTDIVTKLHSNNIKEAISDLKIYLSIINKEEYEFLIKDLIKISVLEENLTFSEPIAILSQLVSGNLKYDISIYIQEFYTCLSLNKFDECKVYLDIIYNSKNVGQDYLYIDKLEKSLNLTNVNTDRLDSLNELIGDKEVIEYNRKKGLEDYCEIPLDGESIESFAKRIHDMLLIDKGIVLVSKLDPDYIAELKNIIKNYNDLRTLIIKDDDEEKLLIRYGPWVKKTKILNDIELGKQAYANKRYEECIRLFKEVLITHRTRPYLYGKIGLSYLKLNNYREALKYLIVAHSISKEQNDNFDFKDIISRLKNEFYSSSNNKLNIIKDDNFGLGDISDITDYIVQSGLDVLSACKQLRLNSEVVCKLLLVYARDFYAQGDIEKGDEFITVVKQIEDKTDNVLNIINIVTNNKNEYLNSRNASKLSRNLMAKKEDSQ